MAYSARRVASRGPLATGAVSPLRVHLKDGRVFDIPMAGLMVVGKTYLDVGILAPGEKLPIAEYVETLQIADITRVDVLTTTAVQVL